jgi:hypothetical protein
MRHPMLTVEDYTGLPEGFDVENGTIHSCPRCGRNGVVRHEAEADFVVHVQTLELMGDGMLDEPRDCCALEDPRRAAGPVSLNNTRI